MKKGGVAREIKGCRRRCLHHPTPTSGGKRREGSEKEETRRGTHTHTTQQTVHIHPDTIIPHHTTPYIASQARARMVCTPHAKLAAARVTKARALTTLTLYDTARDRG